MSEPSNNRIQFKSGIQRKFITEAREKSGLSRQVLSQKLLIHPRTLADWTREKFSMSYDAAMLLSKLTKSTIPKPYTIIDWKDHLRKIGKIGGRNKIIIYGKVATDEAYRSKKWREWWEAIGQYKKNPEGFQSIIKIKIPPRDCFLAEFIGIMLGDGGVAPYHIHITLSNAEKKYIAFVMSLIEQLFDIVPKLYRLKHAEAVAVVVPRKQLVDFCQTIGLALGNKVKQQIDIPKWVKENKKFTYACIRGLMDTDGCFYTNSYHVQGKKYSYLKIAFTSASIPLVNSTYEILIDMGIHARITKNHKEVRIENQTFVTKYIQKIGSHNHKHLEKIKKFKDLRV